ncbi:family 43 glycosylhydrolase [Butyrivibrio sp. AE3009]|uniref:family 43 glycosylhydrolase n=1 Tax=Butyrivibrio sp. AE3009 TaxID=1280666 RepID=UPI0003B6E43A|nr:family 43 glycosylhydrolase [Butyrivibrio sp. AE3009]
MDVGPISLYEAARMGDYKLVRWIVEYSRASLNEFDDDHRTALHYAAESGNLQVFEYLTDRCGLDPLQGDAGLVTPWDIVHENATRAELNGTAEGYKQIESYLEGKYGHCYNDFYRNPIRSGFFPDPSICRVGEDYYMVNSSFIFFPCIPISHSRDLVHWEIIGHAITEPKWAYLEGLEGGRGYWAPDISYYEGRFYIAATYRLNDTGPVYRRQMVVSSDRPEGPYSEPVFIDEDGIDPGFFNDEDGRRYMLLNRGARIFELDRSASKKISEPVLLYYGSNKRAPEGPHIYKKDGYYYLLQAEGGTGPGHRATVSRSRELMGIYEPCPYNPIMRQTDEGAVIQRCGHGCLVDTSDGRWYMVYLCGRKLGDGYSILGRETALDPVTWTADGWPIVNGLKGPSCMQVKPFADERDDCSDEIGVSPCGLPFDYMTPRPFEKGTLVYEATEDGRIFTIKGCSAPMSSIDARNIVLRRQTSFSFEYDVNMEIPELKDGQSAGITGYYDENTYFTFGLKSAEGKMHVFSHEHIGDEDRWTISEEALENASGSIKLSMNTVDFVRTLSYSINGEECIWHTLTDVCYLCDEGLSKGKRFTGATVGMFAYAGTENDLTVRFTDPIYTEI